MKNQILWHLLNGETPRNEDAGENVLQKICMGGFCAAAFSVLPKDGEATCQAALEEIAEQAAEKCSEERFKCLTVCREGTISALISYQTRRDADMHPPVTIAQKLCDELAQALSVPVKFGVGGFCAFYEMIPFSYREALADMESKAASKTIRSIIRFVEDNFADPELSNGVIARASFLNYSYMCTQFHNEIGITLNQYIRMYRMRRALRHLEEPGQSIQASALKAGYDDCKYFSKCFKREFSMTPGRYQHRVSDNT